MPFWFCRQSFLDILAFSFSLCTRPLLWLSVGTSRCVVDVCVRVCVGMGVDAGVSVCVCGCGCGCGCARGAYDSLKANEILA